MATRSAPPSTSRPRDDQLPLVAPALPLTTSTHHPPPRALQGPRHPPAVVLALSAPRLHSSRQEPAESPRTQPLTRHAAAREVGADPSPLSRSTRPDALLTRIAIHVCTSACALSPRMSRPPYPPPSALDGGGLGRPLDHRLLDRHGSATHRSAVRNLSHTCPAHMPCT